MPIIANAEAQEIPWRPGYRNFVLAGPDQGLACVAGYSVIEPGAGAPLHAHQDADEIFILLEGRLELRLGDERQLVEAKHTIAIPAGMPHAFVAAVPCPCTCSPLAAARSPRPPPISKADPRPRQSSIIISQPMPARWPNSSTSSL
jgi:quercetin dioxygenase-like cupin family protein